MIFLPQHHETSLFTFSGRIRGSWNSSLALQAPEGLRLSPLVCGPASPETPDYSLINPVASQSPPKSRACPLSLPSLPSTSPSLPFPCTSLLLPPNHLPPSHYLTLASLHLLLFPITPTPLCCKLREKNQQEPSTVLCRDFHKARRRTFPKRSWCLVTQRCSAPDCSKSQV